MSLLAELKRRNVIRMAGLYLVGAWLLIQIAETLLPAFDVPGWVLRAIVIVLGLGFIPALVFSWVFELTPEGLKRDAEVDPAQSIAPQTARRMDMLTLAGVLLVLVVIAANRYWPSAASTPATTANTAPAPAPAADAAGSGSAVKAQDSTRVAAADKSVAVLPFADLSQTGDQAWFVDGLTEEILNSLARLPELKVSARTSSFQFRQPDRDIRVIADTLGVANVVEGSVRRIGERLRVTAQLIRAADGFHLWSETYDRSTEDLFEVQRDVAEKIAATLDVLLDAAKRERMFASGTRHVAAFEQLQKGRVLFDGAHAGRTGATLAAANAHFERAMALDPTYAQAAVFHSDLYAHLALDGPGGGTTAIGAVELSQQQAIDGLRADLDFAATHAADPILRAVAEINREFFSPTWHRMPALLATIGAAGKDELPSPDGTIWLHQIQLLAGDLNGARRFAERQRDIDPLLAAGWSGLADVEIQSGNLEAARARVAEGRRTAGDHRWLRVAGLTIARREGDRDQVIALLSAFGDDMPWYPALLAAVRCDGVRARQLADELEAASNWPETGLLHVYHESGDADRARALVRRIDALPAGPAIFARQIMVSGGGALMFDLADAPHFSARLAEAGIDPARFPTMPRLNDASGQAR